jgi:peptide deformylase
MTKLEIKIMPDEILRQKAKEINLNEKGEEEQIKKLIDDMLETMYSAEGIGLAGNQVGVLKRILVLDIAQKEGEVNPKVFINPKIVNMDENIIKSEEGCLSIPGIYYEINRAKGIDLKYLDENFKEQRKTFDDENMPRVLQHEIDHLNGILFTDYTSKFKQKRTLSKMKKLKKELGIIC